MVGQGGVLKNPLLCQTAVSELCTRALQRIDAGWNILASSSASAG